MTDVKGTGEVFACSADTAARPWEFYVGRQAGRAPCSADGAGDERDCVICLDPDEYTKKMKGE